MTAFTRRPRMSISTAVPGSVEFTKYAESKGVKVFYVSNRDASVEKSTRENPVWLMVDIQLESIFPRPVTLDELRANQDRHRSPLVLQCIEDHARGQRFPLTVLYTHPAVTSG